MPLSKHFRFCLWWESFFNGGHFSTCQTRKKSTPVTFFLHTRHVFLRPGVISLRRKMTPRSIFDGGSEAVGHLGITLSVVCPSVRQSVRPSVSPSVCHTFLLLITLPLFMLGLSYFTCVFLVTRPFTWYHNF